MKYIYALCLLLTSHFALADNPSVVIVTNQGSITLELFADKSPETVSNFLNYVRKDQYKDSTFHRVINNFMIQGGGFSVSGKRLDTYAPIKNESRNGLSNERGTIAMARTGNPNSATRQFFINHKDNPSLDAKGSQWGYTVFGKVTSGLNVVDDIAKVTTLSQDKPVIPVIINSIDVIDVNTIDAADKSNFPAQ